MVGGCRLLENVLGNMKRYIIILCGIILIGSAYIYEPLQIDATLTGDGTVDAPLGVASSISSGKADVASPTFTGTVTIPTASFNSNNTTAASTAYVDGKVWTAKLAADHAISSTTATEVSCGTNTLASGTYIFTYYILAQSATSSVSPMFGINFTGTAAVKAFKLRYPGTGTTARTGTADDDGDTGGQIEESDHETAYTTTAPNMGATGGVATTGANILYIIEGILIVTASGDLELWHGSETATSTTVSAGTSVVITRTN